MKKIIGAMIILAAFCASVTAQGLFKGLKDTVDSVKKSKEAVQNATPASSNKKKKASTAEEEKPSDAEIPLSPLSAFYIYLNLSDTKITDEMYLDYAKTVEKETYEKYKNDEFEWHDKFEEIKANFNKNVETANVDGKFIIMTTVEIGDYDFTKEGYPFTINKDVFFPMPNVVEETRRYNIAKTALFRTDIALKLKDLEKYNFLPMPKDQAKTFLQARKSSSGYINRKVSIVCHYEISDFNSKEYKDFEKICGKKYLPLMGTISSAEIYDNTVRGLVKLADAEMK